MQIKYHWTYWYNMYAPWRIIRRYVAHKIYWYAERKYGSNLATQKKWMYWMDIKNRVYDVTKKSWADKVSILIKL